MTSRCCSCFTRSTWTVSSAAAGGDERERLTGTLVVGEVASVAAVADGAGGTAWSAGMGNVPGRARAADDDEAPTVVVALAQT